MSVYLDASVLVPIVLIDPFAERARRFLRRVQEPLVVSDLAIAEASAVIWIRQRSTDLTEEQALAGLDVLDDWIAQSVNRERIEPEDIVKAISLVRRPALFLRAPDATHLAVALRMEAKLATFDHQLARAAQAIGCEVAEA